MKNSECEKNELTECSKFESIIDFFKSEMLKAENHVRFINEKINKIDNISEPLKGLDQDIKGINTVVGEFTTLLNRLKELNKELDQAENDLSIIVG
jgi:hypothetical protein